MLSDLKKGDNGILKSHALAAYEYYPFGMMLQKIEASSGYRYGFNGKEKDDEGMGGGGSTYDYGFRIYNPAIAKFLSIDPLTKDYPWNSPYAFAENSPIAFIDLEGLERYYAADGTYLGKYGTSTEIRVVHESEVDYATEALANQTVHHPGYFDCYLPSNMGSVSLNDHWKTINDVTGGAALVTYGSTGDCNAAAVKQLKNESVTPEGRWQGKHMIVDNAAQRAAHNPPGDHHPQLNVDRPQAILTVLYELGKGNPVLVGVSEITNGEPNGGTETRNQNVKTQHFVVIVGSGSDASGKYFTYIDNAPNLSDGDGNGVPDGSDLTMNKFYYETATEMLIDNTSPPMDYAGVTSYKVTETRRNVETKYRKDATP